MDGTKCYKIVSDDYESVVIPDKDSSPTSTSISDFGSSPIEITPNKYCKKYKIGSITNAAENSSGLFCFDSLERAKNYLAKRRGKILECQGFNPKPAPDQVSRFTCEPMLDLFYSKNVKNKDLYFQYWDVPEGTVCFESIKPIKEIP